MAEPEPGTSLPQSSSGGLVSADPVGWQARCRPARLACVELATGERLTYAALDDRVARCAGVLTALLGTAAGERVAVLGRNSIAQIVLALACQRAGAVFVPLNWRLAGAELAQLVADCTPRLLIFEDEFHAAAQTAAGSAQAAMTLVEFTARLPAAAPTEAVVMPADAPAILLYTSGTTGRPKGVVVTCANAFFAAVNFAMVGEIGPASVVLADLPLFHTIGLVAVARTTLTVGGTLLVSDRFLPARTLAVLSDPAVALSHYFCVPQMAAALRADPAWARADLKHLHAIFVGGAPLTKAMIEAFLEDGVPLVNGYGMSEVGTCLHMPIDAAAIRAHPGSIGLPAPTLETRVVDALGNDVAGDAVGELWLRGPAVTPGYWRNPEATRTAFTNGWYRTGDLVRRDVDGFHMLVDRLKDMYISGGENVYPGEVEAALATHPAVAEAAVLGVPDARWGEVGIAYVVLRPGSDGSVEALARHLEGRLARFKRPARILIVDTIPRTASGKIQKHLLRTAHANKIGE